MNRRVVATPAAFILLFVPITASGQDAAPTFHDDVSPLLRKNCARCHRVDGLAPFPLSTYADAALWARNIAEATASRSMPPWLPEPGFGSFEGERRLTDEEIDLLRRWADGGTPEGDVSSSRPEPQPEPSGPFQLGTPDLVVSLDREFHLAAEGHDVYRNFVIPVPIEKPTFVRALELRPGNPKVVHHARILVDRSGRARELDETDPEPGYDGMLVDGAEFPDGLFLGWSPGRTPRAGDDAFVWGIDPSTDLVLQFHMLPSGKPEILRPEVGLYFTENAPRRRAAVLQLGSRTIDIPPGEPAYVVEDRYVLPAAVDVLGIYPHAHYLCREMRAEAILPDGSRTPLLWIRNWDFFWQEEYRYVAPVPLPEGSTISMRYVYDASGQAERVRWGPRSTDEMGDLLLMVSPQQPDDFAVLERDFLRNELRQEIEGYEKTLAEEPENFRVRHELAFSYVEIGRIEEATVLWREVLRQRPDFAEASYNLGGALARLGLRKDAIAAFERAIELNPRYAEAYNNLGVTLQSDGRLSDAVSSYRRAISIRPDYAFARHNLGSALLAQGKIEAALEELGEAVRIAPGYAQAHYTLAVALGRSGRFEEEIEQYRNALESSPDYPEALNNLGSALVASGRPAEALEPLRRALDLRRDYVAAHLNLAAALRALNDLDSAELEYRQALSAEPGNPLALAGLAWLLAVHPLDAKRNPALAVALAERAARASGADPEILDTLALAYAASGRFAEAVTTAETALARARESGEPELEGEIVSRLALYRRGEAYRLPKARE